MKFRDTGCFNIDSLVGCRLAKYYQLQVVTARTILAAAEEMGGTVKQVQLQSCTMIELLVHSFAHQSKTVARLPV